LPLSSQRTNDANVDWCAWFYEFRGKWHPTTLGRFAAATYLVNRTTEFRMAANLQNRAVGTLQSLSKSDGGIKRRAVVGDEVTEIRFFDVPIPISFLGPASKLRRFHTFRRYYFVRG
jgi:hypothetical protein